MNNKFKHRISKHISLESLYEGFKKHLDIEDNLRIFFSAKFGSGKSYFLQDFFESYEEEYEVIKLFPVNYSTASNKDIFDLIKFDILFYLMNHHSDKINQVKLSKFVQIQWFISGKLKLNQLGFNLDILSTAVDLESIKSNFPFWSNAIPILYKVYKTAKDEYSNFFKENKDDFDKVDDFLENITIEFPEYGDKDPIVSIIKETICRINSEGEHKQIVLLIDDLDRLDPEHLFRILNVFGNHLSLSSENKISYLNENKFGFQKIVLVGDINNVQSIFWHRYGSSTDFEGYFSKYFSKCVYSFNFQPLIVEKSIETEITKLKSNKLFDSKFFPKFSNNHGEVDKNFEVILAKLFLKLYSEGQISLRAIQQKDSKFWSKSNEYYPEGTVYSSIAFNVVNYFCWLFDTKASFLKAIDNCTDFSINNSHINSFTNPYNQLFEDLIIYQAKRINNSYELNDTHKDKSSHQLNVDVLQSSNISVLIFRIEISFSSRVTKDLRYLRTDGTDYYPIPQISFKSLIKKFIEHYF